MLEAVIKLYIYQLISLSISFVTQPSRNEFRSCLSKLENENFKLPMKFLVMCASAIYGFR